MECIMNAIESINAWIANPTPADPRDYVPQQREEAAASSRATAAAVAADVARLNDPRLEAWNRVFQWEVEHSIKLEQGLADNRGWTLRAVDILDRSSQRAWGSTIPDTYALLGLAQSILHIGLLDRRNRETLAAVWEEYPSGRYEELVAIPRPHTGPIDRPPSTDWVDDYEEAANAVLLSEGRPDWRWIARMRSFMRDHAVPQGPWAYGLALRVLRHCARHAPRGTI
jgi:hypothetical protein